MSENRTDTFIIGAGLSGLILANRLLARGESVAILEKSRGVGGRMATRRSEVARFDHGAQFYTRQAPLEALHARWEAKSLVQHWFDAGGKTHFKCAAGMTALAKDLAAGIDVRFETRARELTKSDQGWKIHSDRGDFESRRVILTAPLPQSLELLRQSQVDFDSSFERLVYAKAIVALVEPASAVGPLVGETGYHEPGEGRIFSISDQHAKGVSPLPALTVTLAGELSDSLYDRSDDELSRIVLDELRRINPQFSEKTIQIKKWRYSHPQTHLSELYASCGDNLYLAGDAFGGPSLNGAARSAQALANFLTTAAR